VAPNLAACAGGPAHPGWVITCMRWRIDSPEFLDCSDVEANRRWVSGLVLFGLLLVGGCSAPCEDSLGVFPPDHIEVTGIESVEVPHISWTCGEFHSDSMDPPPSVTPDGQGQVGVAVTIEAGSTVDVSFGNQPAAIEPEPTEGANSWIFQVSQPTEPLVVRICSVDRRCAMYWANLYSG
jgi:hypothetical protein